MIIIWVEDEQELLEQGAAYLRREGWEVYGAESAEQAAALIDKVKPDLLLVDWMLGSGETESTCAAAMRSNGSCRL